LKQARVPLNEFQFPVSKIANVQAQLEKLVEKNYYLNKSARDGYRSYLQAYASHSLKKIFNISGLDLQKVAKAFGFTVPPKVNLVIGASGKTDRADRKQSNNNTSVGYHSKKSEGKEFYNKTKRSKLSHGGNGEQWSR